MLSRRDLCEWCNAFRSWHAAKPSAWLLVLLLLGAFPVANAATLTVCASGCDFDAVQDAIDAADSGDIITIAAGTYNEALAIDKDITLQGEETATTIIEPDTYDGVVKIGTLGGGAHVVTINDLTLTGGRSGDGGGLDNQGGIVTLNRCLVTGNSAGGFGGGIFNESGVMVINHSEISENGLTFSPQYGGGIATWGPLTVSYSTIRDNSSHHYTGFGYGGGIHVEFGTTTITHSTLSGNSNINRGGAISAFGGVITISNSTISGNTSFEGGGINAGSGTFYVYDSTITANVALNGRRGAGVYGRTHLSRSVVSGNFGSSDCDRPSVSEGYNVVGTGCPSSGVDDLFTNDPMLGPLQDNGGPTLTHAPDPLSPALHRVPLSACDALTDQRGVSRPQGAACDSGAVEVKPDHYLSYDIKKPKAEPEFEKFDVALADQFQADLFTVDDRVTLLNPVDKNGEGISDPDTHLVGYKVKLVRPEGAPKPPKEPIVGIEIKDQFFPDGLIVDVDDINKADRLLVPASKSLTGPAPPLDGSHNVDHFLCYKAKLPKGTKFPKDLHTMLLADQFIDPDGTGVAQLYNLGKPKRLCNPVDKNGEGIKNEANHLICYGVKRPKGDPKHEQTLVFLDDQFGMVKEWETKKDKELCVPAEKTLP